MAKKIIIDTNVLIIAGECSGFSESEHYPACFETCCEFLEKVVTEEHVVVLDDNGLIMDEYRNKMSDHAENSMGLHFCKWIHDHEWNFQSDRMPITSTGDTFEEFPRIPNPDMVDVSDRKFFALANAHPEKPTIYEACDSKWLDWSAEMKKVGIEIKFLCPELIDELHE